MHSSRQAGHRSRQAPRIPSARVPERLETDVHVLLWQARGQADLRLDGVSRVLESGYALWIPAGTRHEFVVRENSVTMPVFFDRAVTATTLREPTVVTVDRDLRTLLLAYVVASTTIVQPDVDLARQVLAALEGVPVVPEGLPMPSSPAALAIAEALRGNPGDGRTVDELAASVHTSARSIERAYRSETGMTLRRWRIRNRVEAATRLLRGDTTVEAVATRVGYSNPRAFRRVFVEQVGVPPADWAHRFARQ